MQENKLQELDRVNSEQLQKIETDFRQKSQQIADQQKALEIQQQEQLKQHIEQVNQIQQEFQMKTDQTISQKQQELNEQL